LEPRINRYNVGRSFHRQASQYDRHTSVQKRVVNRLVSLVESHIVGVPESLLDVGCGTGQLLSLLREQFPQSRLYGLDLAYNMVQRAGDRLTTDMLCVNADAEQLPFRDGFFNLLVSTSTLQWLTTLDVFFQQARRVLHDNGLLCIAFFGGGTLCELRECYRDAAPSGNGYEERLHRFMDRSAVEQALEQLDFDQVMIMSEIETDYYTDVHELLRSIKRVGAGTSAQGGSSNAGLGWRGVLNETSRLYRERYEINGKIPVSYEVIYVIARCAASANRGLK
jgi:malonyl-CoA O-methyltransferase